MNVGCCLRWRHKILIVSASENPGVFWLSSLFCSNHGWFGQPFLILEPCFSRRGPVNKSSSKRDAKKGIIAE